MLGSTPLKPHERKKKKKKEITRKDKKERNAEERHKVHAPIGVARRQACSKEGRKRVRSIRAAN